MAYEGIVVEELLSFPSHGAPEGPTVVAGGVWLNRSEKCLVSLDVANGSLLLC